MELRAASIRLARQILCFRLNIQRIHDNGREPRYRVRFIHASASSSRMNHRQRRPLSPDRTYQSSTLKPSHRPKWPTLNGLRETRKKSRREIQPKFGGSPLLQQGEAGLQSNGKAIHSEKTGFRVCVRTLYLVP